MTQEQRIIQKAEKDICYISSNGSRAWGKSFRGGFETAVKFTLDNLWIPVEERMPETDPETLKSAPVFVRAKGKYFESFYVARYSEYFQDWISDSFAVTNVTHWMEIPKVGGEE